MKFVDSSDGFKAYYEFGGAMFGGIFMLGDDTWRLSVKGHKNAVLDLEELLALHTLIAKAIVVEKQGRDP